MAGEARGLFPTFIPKTDEERVQNLPDLFAEHGEYEFAATIKVDGSSGTFYFGGPESDVHFGVCSRNWELRETAGNTLWMLARRHNLEEALSNVGGFYAIQGEAFGEGIQGNPEKIKGQELRVFNVFNINEGRKLGPQEYEDFINGLNTRFGCGLKTVPVVEKFVLGEKFKTVDEILAYAEGPSLNPDVTREGIVFKRVDGKFSFKSISNKFLLKHGDR
jgi:RNA ligase (TIGR02306 family)